jgi:hypothetical protein
MMIHEHIWQEIYKAVRRISNLIDLRAPKFCKAPKVMIISLSWKISFKQVTLVYFNFQWALNL